MIEDPVWVRTKMGAELRDSFKAVLKHTKYSPSEAIRLFIRKTIELGPDGVRKACVDTASSLGKTGNPGDPSNPRNPRNSDNPDNPGNSLDPDSVGDPENRNNPGNSDAR
ncbi:hypothetical protein [Stenotrophomonas sp. PS02289]|uniref:hypothetical protein n=1 Tax=Stenotrophomonas sp. PS02289 TaxID=2991422 RepID=UPI00249ADEE9|nr:hypothetical protein [Stenotrophomonas sp. PS02289]